MLFEIDNSLQRINLKRIESILIAYPPKYFKVTMFSGKIIYISKKAKEKVDDILESE